MIAIPTDAREAARKLGAASFRFWILMHFVDLQLGRSELIKACECSQSAGGRCLLDLRRRGFIEERKGEARRLLRVLDATGRNRVQKVR